jgi:hypothetical protein
MIEPGLRKSAAAHPKVTFVMLNIDQFPDTTSKSDVRQKKKMEEGGYSSCFILDQRYSYRSSL